MNLEINEEEVQKLIKQTVVSRVNSHVDKFFKENRYVFNEQVIERYIRDAIQQRVWQMTDDKFNEAAKNFDKKEISESLAIKIFEYMFENY